MKTLPYCNFVGRLYKSEYIVSILGHGLSNFYVRVGDNFNETTFNPSTFAECWHQGRIPNRLVRTQTFFCTSIILGRYVAIHYPQSKVGRLRLCEVAVYKHSGLCYFFLYMNKTIDVSMNVEYVNTN